MFFDEVQQTLNGSPLDDYMDPANLIMVPLNIAADEERLLGYIVSPAFRWHADWTAGFFASVREPIRNAMYCALVKFHGSRYLDFMTREAQDIVIAMGHGHIILARRSRDDPKRIRTA